MMPRMLRKEGPSGTEIPTTSSSIQVTSAAQAPAPRTSKKSVRKTGLRGKSKSTRIQFFGS